MSYDALRRGRRSLNNQVYCITAVTRDRQPVFTDINSACLLIRELRHLHEAGIINSLVWVVMPDHLHWMLQLNEDCQLSQAVKSLKACSALAINNYLGGQGSLRQRAYYDRAARKADDLRQLARYIIANPIRAGLVERIGDYPHWDCIWLDGSTSTVSVE